MIRTLLYAAGTVAGVYVLVRYGLPLPNARGNAEVFLTLGLALAGINALFLMRD